MAETAPDARDSYGFHACPECGKRFRIGPPGSEPRRCLDCLITFEARQDALLPAPQETPNVCEECGYLGPLVEHPGCNYQAGRLNPWPPAPAALPPAVREAAEKYRDAREAGDCRCPGGDCKHALEERYRARNLADAVLSALDSNGGA